MRFYRLTYILLLLCCSVCLYASDVLRVKEYTLSNGLTVWLNEDHSGPQVFGAVVVKAGARDCPDTGIAHYFEHIMFKGTKKIGTIDYESEKIFLDSIAGKYDELAVTEDGMRRMAIQNDINRLSIKAAKYAIPNEFSKLISEYGGSGLNAYTSQDVTVYLNTFSSQYIEHWAELNSERLLAPVFRLFQSELETVYEEKNMYNNELGNKAMDKAMLRVFYPSQYSYSVIGSTKNLKNPRLSDMKAFFEKYYVASNMGLLLSGNFVAEDVLPVLERTFSRLPSGEKPERVFASPDYFKGNEKYSIKIKIPVLKVGALIYEGIPKFGDDHIEYNLIENMLNNPNTGYLNQLGVDRKVFFANAIAVEFDKAGILALAIAPKIPFQSFDKARTLVLEEVERIKTGDFTDEMLEAAKLSLKSTIQTSLEDKTSRTKLLIECFSNDVKWEDFLSSVGDIDAMTKEDVMRVANKYFGDDYLEARKKYGDYPDEKVTKPLYKSVIPPNKDSLSVYAKTMKTLPVNKPAVRLLNFDKDVQTIDLQHLTRLYVSQNPVNDIFTLNIKYMKGRLEDNRLLHLANYLSLIGTDSLSFKEFGLSLYKLGAEISFNAGNSNFEISIKGFDKNYDETVKLVGDFMKNYKVDSKKLKQLKDMKKLDKAMKRSNTDMAAALFEKVAYGEKSIFLKKTEKINASEMSQLFEQMQSVECDIHYCGSNPAKDVEQCVRNYLPLEKIKTAADADIVREPLSYDKPLVYFLDMPKSTQSIIYSYVAVDALENLDERFDAMLYSYYMGGGMFSVMFQEIREFRSLAYSVWANVVSPPWKNKEHKSYCNAFMSTQCDKTVEALFLLDSLQQNMHFPEDNMKSTKNGFYNSLANGYPSFRIVSGTIANYRRNGYNEDPSGLFIKYLDHAGVGNVEDFYKQYIKGKPVVYCITGDSKRVNMKKLESEYRIVKVKVKDIFKL